MTRYLLGLIVGALILISSTIGFGQAVEICNDGKDNNGNGIIDCAEASCTFPANIEKGCRCFDSNDNDGDGKIDATDLDCAPYYAHVAEICNDSKDNNANGQVDCADTGCTFPASVEKGCRCFDTSDNDNDGKIDSADPDCATYYGLTFVGAGSTCSITPPSGPGGPFATSPPETTQQNTADTPAKVVVGDINGDGFPDAAVCSKWNSTVQVIATANASGFEPGDIMSDFRTPGSNGHWPGGGSGSAWVFEYEILIADIDKDGKSELFAIASKRGGSPNNAPFYYALLGFKWATGSLTRMWTADLGPDRPGAPGIADFDGDGKGEVYLKNRIYAAETGFLLADGGGNWDLAVNSGPVAANIAGDAKLELICGPIIYSVPSLATRNATATMTVIGNMNALPGPDWYPKGFNDVTEYGKDQVSTTSTADFNGDGFLDVLMTGAINCTGLEVSPCGNSITTIFYWDFHNGTMQTFAPPDTSTPNPNGWLWGTGRINLGDATGDGKLDALFIAGNQLYCLGLSGGVLTQQWVRTINDSKSGILSLTVYDFNNDGQPEVVYRDSQRLSMVDGLTGQTELWWQPCQSHTWTEGPVIADVNGDGGTDICVTCYTNNSFNINSGIQQQSLGQTRLYFSSTNSWLPTRKVWNQHPYYVTNINDNLTLPYPQVDPAMIFSPGACPNNLPGPQRPLNIFMNQVPRLSATGCPVFPAPDLTFTGDNPATPGVDTDGDGIYTPAVVVTPPICGDVMISAYFNIINSGDLPITDVVPVSFFNGDPRVSPVTATKLFNTTLNISNLQVGQKLVTPTVSFPGPGTVFPLYIVLYNNGAVLPIVLSGQSTTECTISNNIYTVQVTPDPFTSTVEKISDNFKCAGSAPNTGHLRAHIFKGGVEFLDYSQYAFQWFTGIGTSSPIPAPAGTAYNLQNVAEGDYTVVVTNTAKGCSAPPVSMNIVRLGNDPIINVVVNSNQTQCTPPNGALEAHITGGDTGYTFSWFDVGLSPIVSGLGVTTAGGLTAGSYVVLVSKDGCTKSSPAITIQGPNIPDAQAQVLQHVVSCSTPSSGVIQADSFFNGVLQNPANYTFKWYFYNPANTPPKGSILPPIHGTGQTRTGLPIGQYQVEILENATQCAGGATPIVEVLDSRVLPTATITEIAPQTACDPALANGILSADALVLGVVQNPAGFTFEWFKGDNTLPANSHTTVSGVNGNVANKVEGGGVFYTVRVTTIGNSCSATNKFIISENKQVPVVVPSSTPNSICDPAIAGTAYNGTFSTAVTFAGSPVSTFTNYTFTWHQGSLITDPVIPVGNNQLPALNQLNGGYYTVEVKRTDLGCSAIPQTVEVLNTPTFPVIADTNTPSTNCSGPGNGVESAQVDLGGGSFTTTGYSFKWFQGNSIAGTLLSNTPSATGLQGGVGQNYTIEVTNNSSGCKSTKTVTLPDASALPVLTPTPTPNSICDPALTSPPVAFNGAVAVSATYKTVPVGSFAGYVFTWHNGPLVTDPVNGTSTTQNIANLNGGSYTVTATITALGCTSTPVTGVVLNTPVPLNITPSMTGSTNCDPLLKNGIVAVTDVNGLGTGAPFVFQWFDGNIVAGPVRSTTAAYNNVQGGAGQNYTVQVTDQSSGCRNTNTILVADLSVLPTLSLVPVPNSVCDPALTVPPVNFNGQVTATVTNLVAPLTDYTFTWRDGALVTDPVIAGQVSAVIPNRDSGPYTVTSRHTPTGCVSAPYTETVADNKVLPVITPGMTGSTNCDPLLKNGIASVTNVDGAGIGAPYTFAWYNGNIVAGAVQASTATYNNVQGGPGQNYTVLVTNQSSGCQQTNTVLVADLSVLPLLDLATTPNTVCDPALTSPPVNFNGTVTATVTNLIGLIADYSFTWHSGPLVTDPTIAGQTAALLPNADGGDYTVTSRHTPTGCVSSPYSDVVDETPILPAITPAMTGSTNCDPLLKNGVAEVTDVDGAGIGAPYTFKWYDGNVVVPGSETSLLAAYNNVQGGPGQNYTVLVTNQTSGCQQTETILVADLSVLPLLTLAPTPNTVCDPALTSPPVNFNGSITATVTNLIGVIADYSFAWHSGPLVTDPVVVGQTTPLLSNADGGDYTVTAFHAPTGCESSPYSDVVDETPLIPVITPAMTPSTNCDPLKKNGIVEVTDVDGAGIGAPYTFKWYDGNIVVPGSEKSLLAVYINVQGGAGQNYTVLVTNQTNGCQQTHTELVADEKELPIITLSKADNTNCSAGKNGTATLATLTYHGAPVAGPGFAGFTFSWDNAAITASITSLAAATYTLEVTNTADGCTSDPEPITVDDVLVTPVIDIAVTDQTSCNVALPNGILAASVGGLTTDLTFVWHKGDNSSVSPADPTVGATASINSLQGNIQYLVEVVRVSTGCPNSKAVFLPETVIIPGVTVAGVVPLTRCDVPDGQVTATVSQVPVQTYTYYWLKEQLGVTTTDPDVVIATVNGSTAFPNRKFTGPVADNDDIFNGLIPGDYTVVAVDDYTTCISQPVMGTVVNNSLTSIINITLGPILPAACGLAAGQMSATITGGAGGPFDLFWHRGGPINANINFFDNPPQFTPPNDVPFSTAPGVASGVPSPIGALTSDAYTLIVTDAGNGCGNYESVFLPFINSHTITPTLTPSTICPSTSGNGQIQVLLGSIAPARTFQDYSYKLYAGENADPAFQVGATIGPTGVPSNPLTFPSALAPGKYMIEITQAFGSNCPVYEVVEILQDALAPVVTLVGNITANTACDVLQADGSAVIDIQKDPDDTTIGSTYTLDVTPAPVGGGYPIAGLGVGNQTVGGLQPAATVPEYTITVTSSNNCVTQRFLFIPDQQAPAELVGGGVVVTDADLCSPSGKIEVTAISIVGAGVDDIDFFEFEWFSDIALATNVFTDQGDNTAANGGEVLDNVNFAGIGPGSFWVVATKNAPGEPGFGCTSAPFKSDIIDISINPTVNLTAFTNTACDTNYEGKIEVRASDSGGPGVGATYAYVWDPGNPVVIAPTAVNDADGDGTDGDGDNPEDLQEGVYNITVTNNVTDCPATAQVTLLKTATPIVVTDATVVDKLTCSPGGSITLGPNDVTVNGIADPVHTNFNFEWFAGSPVPPTVLSGNDEDVLDNTTYPLITAGDYYVVATRAPGVPLGSGCKSAPLKKTINDLGVLPTVNLTAFTNTACDTNYEGKIEVRANDSGGPGVGGTYSYAWDVANPVAIAPTAGNDADGDGTDGDGDNPLNLQEGTYIVTVTNDVTSCPRVAQVTLLQSGTPVVVADATVVHQVVCSPGGSITLGPNDVTVNGIADPVHTNFNFEWFAGSPVPPTVLSGNDQDVLDNVTYPLISAGDYYVVATRAPGVPFGSGCKSAPLKKTIDDNSINPTVDLTGFTNTACDANYEGKIEVRASDSGGPGVGQTYSYVWDPANPVAIGPTASNDGDGDGTDGDGDNPLNLQEGTYIITVTNNFTNCPATGHATLLKSGTPIVVANATVVHQLVCSPGGSIALGPNDVTVNGVADPVHTNFDFEWFAGSPVPPTILSGNAEDVLDNVTYLTIGPGDYYVVATRAPGVPFGSGCKSAPLKKTIDDNSIKPTVNLTAFTNTACDAAYEGKIEVRASDSGGPGVGQTYSYVWDPANPIAIGPTVGNDADGDGTDGDGDNPLNLQEGTYNITVTNDVTNCPTVGQAILTKTATPIVVANAVVVDQDICAPDGSITLGPNDVTVNGVADPVHTNFNFEWFVNTPTGPTILAGNAEDLLDIGNYASIGAGDYYVIATRAPGVPFGSGCKSAPLKKTIKDISVNPTISFTTLANTSCDNNFDASITVLPATASGIGSAATYDLLWTAVPAGSSVANQTNVPNYTTTAPDEVGPGTFTVRATNRITQCFASNSVGIVNNPQPLDILTVNKTDQLICLPDGSITVLTLSSGGVGNYSYQWFRNDPTTPPLVDAGLAPIVTDNISIANYPTMGSGPFYVVATKNGGLFPGSGCKTPPFRVDVLDLHEDPRTQFAFTPNSSCDNLNPNAIVTADAAEQNGTNTDTYSFAWTLNAGAVPPVTTQTDTNNSSQLDNAFDGNYQLTIVNTTTTGCQFTSSVVVNIDLNVSLPNIIAVNTVDPLDCLASGSAAVTSVSIGGGPPISGAALTTDFTYEWYESTFTPPDLLPTTTPTIAALAPQSYFVLVQDNATKCKSGPREVVITDDDIIYPVVNIVQTARQISCTAITGTAALAATGDGQTDANPNYTFAWYPSLDLTGTSFATSSAITNLLVGNYSVEVNNLVTGCSASSLYIVPNEAPAFTPQIVTSGGDRTLCVGTDGSVLARVINISPDYPFPLTYTADLFLGSTPNLAGAPAFPNVPPQPGFATNFLQSNLQEGFYTVRVIDNNTGCFVTSVEEVVDKRTAPVPVIIEENPLTNCDPAKKNGQLSASADGGKVGGYTFDWYAGTTVTSPPGTLLVSNNKLIAQGVGAYVVRVTKNISGCTADLSGSISDETLIPPVPTPEVVLHRTNCITPNGWVTATVGGVIAGYTFDWYDGTAAAGGIDFTGSDYQGLDIGDYSVTATDQITGCVSPPGTVAIEDQRVIPEFIFESTPSYCSDVGKPQGAGTINLILTTVGVFIDDVYWTDTSNNTPVGNGLEVTGLFPGFYQADAVTSEGCTNTGIAEVKTEIGPYNGMSVNGDASNDNFIIDCITNFPNNNVKIFNRSGIKVFEMNGYDNAEISFTGEGDKGLYLQGTQLPVGTYFYIIDKRDGSKPLAGYLELTR